MDRSDQLSQMSNVSGVSIPNTGCIAVAGCHALNRTPATETPLATSASGSFRPLHVTWYRPGEAVDSFTCNRSVELSVYRTVPPTAPVSPSTCHGSKACRSSRCVPSTSTSPQNGKRNSAWATNQSSCTGNPCCFRSASTCLKSSQTKCCNMNRSCSAVPQRVMSPCNGSAQNRAISARINNCCAKDIRASGGISNPRNSTSPSRPVGPSGENSLSMQISDRWVFPVESVNMFRKSRSTSQGIGCTPCPGPGICASAISISYKASCRASSILGAWLVGPMNSPENR